MKSEHITRFDTLFCSNITFCGKVAKKFVKSKSLSNFFFKIRDKYVFYRINRLNINQSKLSNTVNKDIALNDTIWTGWLQGKNKMPEVVKFCLESIYAHSNGHSVKFITLANLKKYLPDFPNEVLNKLEKKKIEPAHFMDIVRIMLIRKYGGIWIDPTVFLTVDLCKGIFDMDFYSYKGVPSPWGSNPAQSKWCTFFMGGKENSLLYRVIEGNLLTYWKGSDRAIDYFLLDYMMQGQYVKDSEIKHEVDKIPQSRGTIFDLNGILAAKCSNNKLSILKKKLLKEPLYKLTYKDKRFLEENSVFEVIRKNYF